MMRATFSIGLVQKSTLLKVRTGTALIRPRDDSFIVLQNPATN